MKISIRFTNFLLLLSAFASLSACSGGGGSSGSSNSDPIRYTITTDVTGSGGISPSSQTVSAGGSASFAVSSDEGYELSEITGCGGSLSENTFSVSNINSDCTILVTFAEIPKNEGGTPSNPIPVSLSLQNAISPDPFNNYFSIELTAGERLYLFSTLESSFSAQWAARCATNPSSYGYGIHIKDIENSCGYSLAFTQGSSAQEIIHIDYPDAISGYFYADIVDENGVEVQVATGNGGIPSQPREFLFGEDNNIAQESFFNFYAYNATAGETIYIYSYPNGHVDDQLKSRCAFDSSFNSTYALGVSVNEGSYSCSEQFEYTFPEDGLYVFHLKFLQNTDYPTPLDGYFQVEIGS